jgi:hypothetical protein
LRAGGVPEVTAKPLFSPPSCFRRRKLLQLPVAIFVQIDTISLLISLSHARVDAPNQVHVVLLRVMLEHAVGFCVVMENQINWQFNS